MIQVKSIRVEYEPGETGWADDLEDGRVRIANIPYRDGLNIGDVVLLDASSEMKGRRVVASVISRKYVGKTCIEYPAPFRPNWKKLYEAYEAAGCMAEGILEGKALVAHQADQDPVQIAKDVGIEVTKPESQPEKLDEVYQT